MQFSQTTSKEPLKSDKRTKIIATIGPSTDSYEVILSLIDSGVDGLRINFSSGTYAEREQQIKWVRKASKELGKAVAIIQDLQGPKIRLGDFGGIITVQKGQTIRFGYKCDYEKTGQIPVSYDLSKKVKRGEAIYLYDGKVRARVSLVKDSVIYAEAENEGILIAGKNLNLPDTDFEGDVITKKDKADLALGSTQDIDYVSQGFVQTAEDVVLLRILMNSLGISAKLIVRFETKSAVSNMENIVEQADALIVSKADLAAEIIKEQVPIIQHKLLGLCINKGKPIIVATPLQTGGTQAPDPSQAETSDMTAAILAGADAVMLSDETANDRYLLESVKVTKRVIRHAEANTPFTICYGDKLSETSHFLIAQSVIKLATGLKAKAIIAETKSGYCAIQIANNRTTTPVIAVSGSPRVAQQLAVIYGLRSFVRPIEPRAPAKLGNWLVENHILSRGDLVVIVSGEHPGVVGSSDTIKVRVLE